MVTKKNIDYYLNLNWSYTIEQEDHKGKHYYIIRVNELPGICTDAESIEEGMELIKECIEGVVSLYLKNGEEVPEPIDRKVFKGKILYRTDSERHFLIAKAARTMHKSLSKTLDHIVDHGLKTISLR